MQLLRESAFKSVIFDRTLNLSCPGPIMSNAAHWQSFLTTFDALQPFLGESDMFIGYQDSWSVYQFGGISTGSL